MASLKDLIRHLEGISTDLRKQMLAEVAKEAESQVTREFRQAVDPTGNPWAPLKSKSKYGWRKPLQKTRKLSVSFRASPTSVGFTIRTSVPYAIYPQDGTRRMAARKIIPTSIRNSQWVGPILARCNRAIIRYMKGQ